MDNNGIVATKQALETYITLTPQEAQWFSSVGDKLPFLVSRYYLALINPDDPNDPIRRQVIPSVEELDLSEHENIDPLAEEKHSVLPRLIHRYENRVALLVTDRCATYCRHCFRRRFTATEQNFITRQELSEVQAYLKQNSGIKEILLTGGDPLTLSDMRLRELFSALYAVRKDLVIRLCTRIPATYPQRVTEKLVAMLTAVREGPIYLLTQFNHPRELTAESQRAVNLFVDNGIPAFNQTVLLRGVNDDLVVLEELMNSLLANRIKPYYLFQGDLVAGTKHLRVPLERGLLLEEELVKRLSGLAMPTYAVDLPNGGGKVPLGKNYLLRREGNVWVFKTPQGEIVNYSD